MSARKVLLASLIIATALTGQASSETIQGALAKAYKFNSTMNSARAGLRATDENVAIAKSGYRPTVGVVGSAEYSSNWQRSVTSRPSLFSSPRSFQTTRIAAGSIGIQLNQMLFDGFQTKNNVRAAEAQVRATQESLRNTEQNTLYEAATAYMDVIRDRQVATLTEQNLAFLSEQVRAARSRFDVGEGTRTDVAQADAERAGAIATLNDAKARVLSSSANYRQIVGEEPGKLSSAKPLATMLPKSLDSAQGVAVGEHPAILASEHLIDAANFAVKAAEGALLPQLDATLQAGKSYQNNDIAGSGDWSYTQSNTASVGATLTVPLYQGGRVAAIVRQDKEKLGQARINLDVNRDQVRSQLAQAWASYNAAREGVQANRTLVSARQLALNGVIEERNVGQRTTLDVLNAQADVISAQISLASDEHDVVVASYAILNAMGRLTAGRLGLGVTEYKPKEHYEAVKDKWFGLRTPDGR